MNTEKTRNHPLSTPGLTSDPRTQGVTAQGAPTVTDIQAWLVHYLAELLEIDPAMMDVTLPFERYGLDSAAVVALTGDLEDWLGGSLDPTLPYDYPTIGALAQHVAAAPQGEQGDAGDYGSTPVK